MKNDTPSTSLLSSFPPVRLSLLPQSVRQDLYDHLTRINPDKDWSFILRQIGMFSFTGLTPPQVGLGEGVHWWLVGWGGVGWGGVGSQMATLCTWWGST